MRGTNLERKFTSSAYRIDGDDGGSAGNSGALNRAQPKRPAAHNRNSAAGRHHCERTGGCRAQPCDTHTAQDHSQVRGRSFREDGYDPFLECHHQLGETPNVRIGIHRGAIAHLGNRDKITRQVPAKQLTHICTAPKAVVARAALGRARDAHTIPNLDPPHLGSDRLHHANAAMSLHEGHVIHVRTGEAD